MIPHPPGSYTICYLDRLDPDLICYAYWAMEGSEYFTISEFSL